MLAINDFLKNPKQVRALILAAVVIPLLAGIIYSAKLKVRSPVEEKVVTRVSQGTVKISAEGLRNIKVVKLKIEEYPEQLAVMGRVSPTEDRVAVIPARIAGRIDGVSVSTGEPVVKDQLLASVFSPDYVVAREEYVQTLKQIKTSAADVEARNFLTLSIKKLESMGMSRVDIDQLGTSQEKQFTNLLIRAPRGGVLIDKKAIIGNFVNQGDTLFTLADLNKVWFVGDLYPEDLPKVKKDQEVTIENPNGQQSILGKVSFISPVIDPTTRTIRIRALMDNPGNGLRADMYVKGNIVISKKQALVAPRQAFVTLRDSKFCFKQTSEGVFQRVVVEFSDASKTVVAVASGLQEGDSIVSEGALLLDAALNSSEQ